MAHPRRAKKFRKMARRLMPALLKLAVQEHTEQMRKLERHQAGKKTRTAQTLGTLETIRKPTPAPAAPAVSQPRVYIINQGTPTEQLMMTTGVLVTYADVCKKLGIGNGVTNPTARPPTARDLKMLERTTRWRKGTTYPNSKPVQHLRQNTQDRTNPKPKRQRGKRRAA